jgi:hypothetical protein
MVKSLGKYKQNWEIAPVSVCILTLTTICWPVTLDETNTHKNAQVVTGLQTSCYKSVHMQAVDKLCSHCLFPVVVTSLEQAVNNL